MIKLFTSFDGHLDKSAGVLVTETDTIQDALLIILDELSYGWDEENPASVDELLNAITATNGDGCEFIISIISSTGDLIYVCE